MRTIFVYTDRWDLVENGFEEPEDEGALTNPQKNQLKEQRKKDLKALSLIQQEVSEAIFPRIINATKANEAWDILQKEYRGNLKVRTIKLQSLKKDFENIKMKDVELLKDYFSSFTKLMTQMKIYGDNISNQRVVEKILLSLSEKYNSIVVAIEETKDLADLSIEELMGSEEEEEEAEEEEEMQMEEQEIQKEEKGLIFKERKMKSPLNKSVEFAIEAIMLIKTVGFRKSQNVTIATNLGMSRRIGKSRALNKLISREARK
ncbi:uncharacterized protein LOC114296030 [Camellia sinensis]|uniref:uncharacterized protein LOC114296030 n=1 Tax=Camellia sinensis TaxID=4442 RepID=UPI00103619A7|nr:uncharacterized protein LOC114296030 [Camellia sinensis]